MLSLAEMASMAPTAGGQYHWVSEFSPPSLQKPLSFFVGWMSTLSWQAGTARRYIDSVLRHRHVPRLLANQLARYSHGHCRDYPRLGIERLGIQVDAHLSECYAAHSRFWIPDHYHCLLGSLA
jgi:hypothetical protein